MNQRIATCAIIAITMTISCTNKTGTKQPKNIVVAVKMCSCQYPPVMQGYKSIISNSIISNLGTKDAIKILPIDSGSLQAGLEIQTADFSVNNYSNENSGNDKEKAEMNIHYDSLAALKQRFSIAYDSAFAQRAIFQRGADVTGCLESARKYHLSDHENVLIIFSDMQIYHDYGKGLVDFQCHLNDTSEISAFLNKVPQLDLRGWKVIVITGQLNISATKFSAIQAWWERYFSLCHCELKLYTCCSISLLENELRQ